MLTICEIAEQICCKPEQVCAAMNGEMECFGMTVLPSVIEHGRKVIREEDFEQWVEENMARIDLAFDEKLQVAALEAMLEAA